MFFNLLNCTREQKYEYQLNLGLQFLTTATFFPSKHKKYNAHLCLAISQRDAASAIAETNRPSLHVRAGFALSTLPVTVYDRQAIFVQIHFSSVAVV